MDYNKNLNIKDIKYFCEFDLIWKIEEWRDVPNYEGLYMVSDLGRMKSLKKYFGNNQNIIKGSPDKDGYYRINLHKSKKQKNYNIHQLVSISFLEHITCGMELVINHKNFIRTDNRKLNLEIVTSRENSNRKHIKHTSKYTGVCWDKKKKEWSSTIIFDKKKIHLGYFDTEEEASKYYENAILSIKNKMDIKVKRKPHSSIYKGVSWVNDRTKWRSKITIDKKPYILGYFINEIDAHNAYQEALKSKKANH